MDEPFGAERLDPRAVDIDEAGEAEGGGGPHDAANKSGSFLRNFFCRGLELLPLTLAEKITKKRHERRD